MLKRFTRVMPLAAVSLMAIGCMPKMDLETMREMMPEKPAELEALNSFVGEWTSTATMNMAGLEEPVTGTGTSKLEWQGDGWYLVEHAEYHMEGLGDMKAIGVWTYDPRARKYRSVWVDSMGGIGTGKMSHCPETGTWKMKAKMKGPMGTVMGKGKITDVDENTKEWCWQEHFAWDLLGLFKINDMTGTMKRK